MQNPPQSETVHSSSITPFHPLYPIIYRAYAEVFLDKPFTYDSRWPHVPPHAIEFAEENYEVVRQACLHLKLLGTLPRWLYDEPIPHIIINAIKAVRKEARLGRELNLVLDLLSTTLTKEDLADVY